MYISKEIKEKITLLFKTDHEMIEKLYNCDVSAIREIGILSHKGINPNDVIVAYESENQSAINDIYQQAKRLVELQELYKELCYEYYQKQEASSEYLDEPNSHKKSF